MKIAVVAPSPVPFVFGGAERFWLDLVRALNEHTPHEVELVKLPFPERDFWQVVAGYRRFFTLDLSAFDCIISSKYPAWMVQHPRHIVYMQHKLRGLYDAYPAHLPSAWPKERALKTLGKLVAEPNPTPVHAEELFNELEKLKTCADPAWFAFPGPLARGVVHFLDRIALRPGAIWRYAAISHTVANRPNYFPPQAKVHVVHHPSGLKVESQPFPDQPIVFTASRLDAPKRIDLLIRAFRRVPLPRARLHIAGSGPQEASLRQQAEGDERIVFLGRISDFELARAYGKAQVVAFVPEQEDLGLVALEAGLAGRPVVTCRDSGGVVELVHDQISGWVVEPQEAALANALAELLNHPERARALGEAAKKRAAKVSWSEVIAALGLDGAKARSRKTPARPAVVLAPFSLRPPRFGGANRIFHLYRAWAQHTPVHVLSLSSRACQVQISPSFTVSEIAFSTQFVQHATAWSAKLKAPAWDLALLDGMQYLPDYCAAVAEWAAKARLVVVSHPYCLPALPVQELPPLVYDAHNVEYDLKAQLWQEAKEAWRSHALALVRAAEAEAVERAKAVLTVCQEDAERLAALYRVSKPWILAPNGVDLKTRPFLPEAEKRELARRLGIGQPLAAFVGSWHGPNIAALDTILACAKALPGVLFAVAGSVSTHPKLQAKTDNVILLGTLSDAELTVLLQAADVGLNPITQGAGTNLKVLDYAACGEAILSTPFGMRGLPFIHGQSAWLCAPEDFPDALARLIADHRLRIQLAQAARKLAERFAWEQIGSACLQALAESIQSCPSMPSWG